MRFDDRVTGNLKTYAPHAKKIHVEIDPSEMQQERPGRRGPRRRPPGRARGAHPDRAGEAPRGAGSREIDGWRAGDALARHRPPATTNGRLLAAHVIHDLWKTTGGDAIVVTDVGQHQMWEAQYYKHDAPAHA